MDRISERKIVLVTRKTRIDDLVARFNTENQARFYIEHLGDDFEDYQNEHQKYYKSLQACTICLSKFGRLHQIDRSFLPNYSFGTDDLIAVLGQDGLVANTIKYLDGHAVVGINPDPDRWDGILLPFTVHDLEVIMYEVLSDKRTYREITMAKASLNTGEQLYAVNDFFIGPKSHTSARYLINSRGKTEEQSSSGVIISTGLGSTGWHKSLMAGASGIAQGLTGKRITQKNNRKFTWESNFLYFTVREPFPSARTQASIIHGMIKQSTPLTLVSKMAGQGVIFSDGIENDFVEFNSGTEAIVTVAERKGRIIQ